MLFHIQNELIQTLDRLDVADFTLKLKRGDRILSADQRCLGPCLKTGDRLASSGLYSITVQELAEN
jgi:hypothetical protein